MSQTITQQAEVARTATLALEQMDVLDQLMKPEIQQSITVLVANLPKLAEITTILTKTYDLVQTVANDHVLIEDLKGGMEEFVKPIQDKAKVIAQAAIEAIKNWSVCYDQNAERPTSTKNLTFCSSIPGSFG